MTLSLELFFLGREGGREKNPFPTARKSLTFHNGRFQLRPPYEGSVYFTGLEGALGSYASSRTTDRNAKTSAFPVDLENAVRGQNPERSYIWKMCPTVGATKSLRSLCPPLIFPESSAVFMYLHGTNKTPRILAPTLQ